MSPEQKIRLKTAALCSVPISAKTTMPQWLGARKAIQRALIGRDLERGLAGAVFVEACREMDRYIVRTPGVKQP